jgi:hypothetical protein
MSDFELHSGTGSSPYELRLPEIPVFWVWFENAVT